jgi:nicotinate (nicotinamide) nucleotide adenylyltransferase
MEFFQRTPGSPLHLGVLPGAFNPITVAHLELAQVGLAHCDEVLFVLPRVFPHKSLTGASFEERLGMLQAAVAGQTGYSVAASSKGLFVEIAGECREAYGNAPRLTFLCGRDAAERIAAWDYGEAGAFPAMLDRFQLLVADRRGEYSPTPDLSGAVRTVRLSVNTDLVSATEVRNRITDGEAWEHLVPEAVREEARRIYAPTGREQPGISPRCW